MYDCYMFTSLYNLHTYIYHEFVCFLHTSGMIKHPEMKSECSNLPNYVVQF